LIMEEIKKRLKREIKEGRLEEFFLSVLEENPSPELLRKIFSLLAEEGKLPLSPSLFFLVIDYLKERGDYISALEILKMQAEFSPQDFKLRKEAIELLKLAYPEKEIGTYISRSHLDLDRNIKEGIETVEKFLKFPVEGFIFSHRFGLGRIKGYDFLLEKAIVEFAGKEEKIPISLLFQDFLPLSPDHFLVQKAKNPEVLRKMALEDPFSLFLHLLKSFGRLKISEVKSYLSGIISDWEDYWHRVRAKVSSSPQIRVKQGKERIYEWGMEEGRRMGNKECEIQIDSLPLEKSAIMEIFPQLPYQKKKDLLVRVKRERADWIEILREVFFQTRDERIAHFILQNLERETEEAFFSEVFTNYRSYPFLLYFLAKQGKGNFSPKAIFFRVYELLGNNQYKDFWRYFKILLRRKEFFTEAVKEMNEEERERLLSSLSNIPSLLPYEKKEIEKLLKGESREEGKEVIYNTEKGIKMMEERLNNLIRVELKRNAEALARARSFGDLKENYEYKIAKEERVRLLNQIKKLKGDLEKARPILFPKGKLERVSIGTKVKMKNKEGEIKEWTILGPWDIDLEKGIISYLSPFGRSLLGKRIGEKAIWGEEEYEIIGIESGESSKG